jgi:hypothetical protein
MMTPEERHELVLELTKAIACAQQPQLSDEELRWVKLAIEAEARKIKFRDAIIEKTLVGLAWLAITGIGYILFDWFKAHIFKP